MIEKVSLQGRKVVGGKASGKAIISEEPISFIGGVNPDNGIITESGHPLEGRCISNKVLIYPIGKGSTGTSYRIYDMHLKGTAPIAFLQINSDPIAVIGAIISNIPMIDSFDHNLFKVLKDGDFVEVNADTGTIFITKCLII